MKNFAKVTIIIALTEAGAEEMNKYPEKAATLAEELADDFAEEKDKCKWATVNILLPNGTVIHKESK